ncbi:MAG: DUF5684 domain-containing protein [Candidatus Nanopelagicales bacterium]
MDQTSTTGDQLLSGGVLILAVFWVVFMLAAGWKMYTKAGQPGWTSLIPILNTLVLLRIVRRPWWWLLLLLIPIANVVLMIIVYSDLAKAFGHGLGMTLLLILLTPIAYLVLGFGQSRYLLAPDRLLWAITERSFRSGNSPELPVDISHW